MLKLGKKTTDSVAEKYLLAAAERGIELSWDRYEGTLPQCGFGKLALCCQDCLEGPCRLNPFSPGGTAATICGAGADDLSAAWLVRQTGQAALSHLAALAPSAQHRSTNQLGHLLSAGQVQNQMPAPERVRAAVELARVDAALQKDLAGRGSDRIRPRVKFGLSAVDDTKINILVNGFVRRSLLEALVAAAAEAAEPARTRGASGVRVMAIAGGVPTAGLDMDLVCQAGAQELPMLDGAVDLLIAGEGCVMPAAVKLAGSRPVLSVRESTQRLTEAGDWAKHAIDAAAESFGHRSRSSVTTLQVEREEAPRLLGGGEDPFGGEAAASVSRQIASDHLKGVVLVAGCAGVKRTMGETEADLTTSLVSQGYLVYLAGCAGLAACIGDPALADRAESGVRYVGSCLETSGFIEFAQAVGRNCSRPGVCAAVLCEATKPASLANALAMAAGGIRCLLGSPAPLLGSASLTALLARPEEGLLPASLLVPRFRLSAEDLFRALVTEEREEGNRCAG